MEQPEWQKHYKDNEKHAEGENESKDDKKELSLAGGAQVTSYHWNNGNYATAT
jgi:hypothetical protein